MKRITKKQCRQSETTATRGSAATGAKRLMAEHSGTSILGLASSESCLSSCSSSPLQPLFSTPRASGRASPASESASSSSGSASRASSPASPNHGSASAAPGFAATALHSAAAALNPAAASVTPDSAGETSALRDSKRNRQAINRGSLAKSAISISSSPNARKRLRRDETESMSITVGEDQGCKGG